MSRTVKCVKLGRELPGLDRPPIPGELGKSVYDHVSKEAWQMFENHFKMVMNEYRLNLMDPRTDEIFRQQVVEFLFSGKEPAKPDHYSAPAS